MLGVDVFNYGHVIQNPNRVLKAEGVEADFATGDSVKIAQHCLSDSSFTDGWVEDLSVGSHTLGSGMTENLSAIYVPEGFKVTLIKEDPEAETGQVAEDEFFQIEGPRTITCLVEDGWNDKATKVVVEQLPTCATMNRVNNGSDYVCGACADGYTEDPVSGLCVRDAGGLDENVILIGGLAFLGLLAVSMLG